MHLSTYKIYFYIWFVILIFNLKKVIDFPDFNKIYFKCEIVHSRTEVVSLVTSRSRCI